MEPVLFEIRFLDTIGFMNTGIEQLVDNMKSECKTIKELRETFKYTSEHFTDDKQFLLMTQKGIYPYDYIDDYNKMNDTKLPSIDNFYSQLYDSGCDEKDYKRALEVWETFNCKTFLDYHNLYLSSDVLLLTDIWESFKASCYKNYQLDPTYYFTLPGYSFDVMLKYTGVELELFTEIEHYEFMEAGIRGGLSQISTRYAKANNKYMRVYDPTQEESYIVYLDANNLYGGSMNEYLPYGGFKLSNTDINVWNRERIMNISDEADIGYTFKVSSRIPLNKHNHMNNYPPFPESTKIKKENLNVWQQENYTKSNVSKLCCSFEDKHEYVINYRCLKLYLSLGCELLAVHQVMEYKQKPFLRSYNKLNTDLRTNATNEFEKDLYKLMNNAVFGKTMENVRERITFRLITNEESAWRQKNLKSFTIFDDDLVGVHIQKQKILLNKPVYLGQTILDDAKKTMYNFHYNFMLKQIKRENIDLLFTDTDSLCYHIKKQDIFKIIGENKEHFDLSNYDKNHELYDPTNKKVINKFKNESVKQITEFAALRAKCYAYRCDGDDDKVNEKPNLIKHLTCKGIKKCVVKKNLNIDLYKNVLFTRESKTIEQNGIRSYKHQLYTETVSKIGLSCNDDKLWIHNKNIKTRNFGHWRTDVERNLETFLNNRYNMLNK